ncbi:1-deoxy-d-xylulose 5-phosphate reductoisomerase chloroplastic-like, partial [Trifolium pratense]
MALNLSSPAELKSVFFTDPLKSNRLTPKFSGGLALKRKENGRRVYCSVQSSSGSGSGPPPAWPGRAIPELAKKTWEGPKPISIVGCTGSIGTQV